MNNTDLTIAERVSQALSLEYTEAELKAMANKYADVTEIKDDTDYQLVKRGGIVLGKTRVSIEEAGKAARDDANKFRTAVIAEERRLTGIIQPEEVRLKAMRKDVDDAAIQKAAEVLRIEQNRVADITDRIQTIQSQTDGLFGSDSMAIQRRLDAVNSIVINEALFSEYLDQADKIKSGAVIVLEKALSERKAFEEQRAETERIAKVQAERQAKLDKQAEEQRKQEEKNLAAERAEADKVRKERDRLELEAREHEHAEQVKAEQEAEAVRKETLRPEKARLVDWAKKLRFIDGIELHDETLIQIQRSAIEKLTGLSTNVIDAVENA